jgi:hypothetical protein
MFNMELFRKLKFYHTYIFSIFIQMLQIKNMILRFILECI